MLGSRGSKSGRGGKDGGNRTVREEPFPQEDDGEAACRDDHQGKVSSREREKKEGVASASNNTCVQP